MSLRKRLLLYLLLCAPAVWAVALLFSVQQAKREVNEMFDTELIRLAQQVQATLGPRAVFGGVFSSASPRAGTPEAGDADVRDLAIAVWDAAGRRVITDREGVQLPHRRDASGFVDEAIDGRDWRTYYLQSSSGAWLVAAGQRTHERDELIVGLILSQLLPWLVMLPVLLVVMAWAVGEALAPVRRLAGELRGREASDLRPVEGERVPSELRPLVEAMNVLFGRIHHLLQRERRFTADAAHELRTPLAVLRAQWDVVRHARGSSERADHEQKLSAGLERMDRLVTQMLSLSRLDAQSGLTATTDIDWRTIVEQAMSDSLALAERRRVELVCEWPAHGRRAFPLTGDANLLTVLLRNLLDNAVRYTPAGTSVTVRFHADRLEVDNEGPALTPAQVECLGARFHRLDPQAESGSGLGVSIVRRIAALHGLEVVYGSRDGHGVRATVRLVESASDVAASTPRAGSSQRARAFSSS